MATLHSSAGGKRVLLVKGAPEVILEHCNRQQTAAGQPVLYITERCVFRLVPDGLELIEIAPGIDLEKDVLDQVGFTPIIDDQPKLMDAKIFRDEPMGLKDDLLTVPLDVRFSYDAERSIFFINMEGVSVNTQAEAEARSPIRSG